MKNNKEVKVKNNDANIVAFLVKYFKELFYIFVYLNMAGWVETMEDR